MSPESRQCASRKDKWIHFFNDTSGEGPNVLSCIKKKNPAWKNSSEVASRLSYIYASVSDNFHATSHAINSDRNKSINVAGVQQTINALICIGDALHLNINYVVKE